MQDTEARMMTRKRVWIPNSRDPVASPVLPHDEGQAPWKRRQHRTASCDSAVLKLLSGESADPTWPGRQRVSEPRG